GLVKTDFVPSGYELANALVVQADNKVVVTGQSNGKLFVGRYNPDGTLDATFGAGGKAYAGVNTAVANLGMALAIQGDGKYVVAGQDVTSSGWNYSSDFLLARFNADGTLDRTFDKDGIVTTAFGRQTSNGAVSVVLQAGGKILVGGNTSSAEGYTLARYNAN